MSPRIVDSAALEAREEDILSTALQIIGKEGVAGLTIDRVVAQLPFSKGTVYNHFCCKEDLLTALCNKSIEGLSEMFKRAAEFEGNSRERMLAIGFAYMLHSQLNPTEFMLVISAKTPAVREKSSAKQQEKHLALESQLLGSILNVINAGLASGELGLLPHLSPSQVAFSVWAMSFGTIALLHESLERCSVRTEMMLERELINHTNMVLDGLNWKPFTMDHDWAETVERLKNSVFPEEVLKLEKMLTH
jgi:AcrR family transcriptional regulator